MIYLLYFTNQAYVSKPLVDGNQVYDWACHMRRPRGWSIKTTVAILLVTVVATTYVRVTAAATSTYVMPVLVFLFVPNVPHLLIKVF